MVTLVNRAYVSTATTGTGAVTLGAAKAGFQDFAASGVTNGDIVRYVITDGSSWEIGTGTYSSTGPTLTRTPSQSSNGGAAINLSGDASVFITAAAEDILQPDNNLSDLTNAVTARTNLGLAIGTNVQAWDANLDQIAALAVTDGNFIVGNGSAWVAESSSTARTSLGIGTLATQNSNSVSITGGSITGITDLAVADGGTGASSFTANNVLLGNGTAAFQTVAPGTSGNVLTSNGTTWTSAAAPGAINGVFYENDTNVTQNYTITSGKNAMSAGPVTIDSGVTVTVPSGSTWTVVT
jgi:hypothetical protein